MRKLLIFFLSVSLSSVVIALSSNSAFAATSTSTLSIPPTAEGPGLVIPDSPLFFLDIIKQEFRLLLAFTPEQKAKVHKAIAGERLAELRIMLAKNNTSGIRTALQGISDNLKAASADLTDARLTGRNIDVLSKEINDSIKEKQKILSALELQATGETKAQVMTTKEALTEAKMKVEENLPTDLMANEIIDDLSQQINDNINSASHSASEINRDVGALTKLASVGAAFNRIEDIKSLISEFQKASVSLQKEGMVTTAAKSTGK